MQGNVLALSRHSLQDPSQDLPFTQQEGMGGLTTMHLHPCICTIITSDFGVPRGCSSLPRGPERSAGQQV